MNELEVTLKDRIKLLPKMFSTWATVLGGIIIAAPIDWTTFDYRAITKEQVILGVAYVLVQLAARVKKQASMTTVPTPTNTVTTLIRPADSPEAAKVAQQPDDPTKAQ